MNEDDIRAQLEAEYDRVIKETLQKLYRSKPLNRAKITAALMAANKAYWTARLALLDNDAVYAAGRVSGALAMSYYYAAEDLAEQVQHVYAGYRSAFHLSQKGAKELLDKVVYDRPIAETLQRIADAMPAGEEKTRILAEISAPAYRYRMQRAEQIAKNAQEACENIARGEIAIDRQFLQTEIEKAYNISLDGALSEPPSGEIADMLSGDVVLDRPVPAQPLEMPRADEPVRDFTPTDDRGIMDSFSVVSTDHAREIMENRWSGESFSERIWSNTDDLAQEVKQVILEGELTGASEAKMAAKIRDRFTVGMHEARRVVRTEHNYCINQAELKGMKDAGFDEYEFISLGEEADNVCHTCDDLDGERFKIEDAVVGVNCPPMHPFCRCKATTPMETKEDVQADIDRLLDGRSIEDIERELDAKIEQENQRKLLTTAKNGGIINTDEQKKLKEMRDNGNVTSTINEAVQRRHYRGTNEYNTFLSHGEEKSYFYVPIEDLQKFVDDNMATGNVFLSKNQNEANEILFYGKTVGYDTKLQRDTSFVKVFYSKDRTHLSPFTPADEEG
jgi:SPP1 gp7 family putative phage head morphogenesis protein